MTPAACHPVPSVSPRGPGRGRPDPGRAASPLLLMEPDESERLPIRDQASDRFLNL